MLKVSVIIPIYCVEKYIFNTVKSVLDQTYTDFEVLLINDETTDGSLEICQQFLDPRIIIVSQKNRGLAGARNTGIRHARGEYLAFLDGDDLWLPDKLEKHVKHLDNSPSVGLSFSRSAFIDEAGNRLGTFQMPKLSDITASHLLCRNPVGNGSAPVIRREVFEGIRFQDSFYGSIEDFYFDDRFRQSEDIECWLRIAIQTSWKLEGIPEALTLYRVNSEGLSANLINQLASWEKVIDKVASYAPELVAKWGLRAKAYQLRYLARRAVRLRDGSMAVKLTHSALATNWRILLEEPRRTLFTIAASYILWCFPKDLFYLIENLALNITGKTQTRKINESQ
jgi:glycosyltransferase involved in cell wall biosynthesis